MRARPTPLAVAAVLACLLLPEVAHASLFGEENGPLTTLVAQGVAEFVQVGETLTQLKQTYEETAKYVGLAEDAIEGFQEFGAFADSVFKNPQDALASVLPDAAYLGKELQSPSSWGRGTGELQRLVKVCLGGGDCASFREAVTATQAREAISRTFGTSPVKRDDVETVDVEAAHAIRGSMAQTAKATVAGEQARALMEKCLRGTDNQAVAACQAAANLGQLMQVEQTAALNEQTAEANRLQALELAERNSEKKRGLQESLERQRMLEAGAAGMAPLRVRFQGPDGVSGGRVGGGQ